MKTALDPLGSQDRVVVLSGAGLSKASGIPTFRDAGGLWEGHDPMVVATPEAWHRDPDLVRRFYDARRIAAEGVTPNPGHAALAELQAALGPDRVALVTQNIDGLLQAAGATDVIEMHGSLRHVRCTDSEVHPWVEIRGPQDPAAPCELCHDRLRPAIVWFGEIPLFMDRIEAVVTSCTRFVSVGTSGTVYPAAGLSRVARMYGATTIEVNPEPSGGLFDHVVADTSEAALPRLVRAWLGPAHRATGRRRPPPGSTAPPSPRRPSPGARRPTRRSRADRGSCRAATTARRPGAAGRAAGRGPRRAALRVRCRPG